MFAVNMERAINKSQRAQAASPIREITTMLDNFVKPISQALLAVTVLVCIVSGVSILVSIYNSMNERRRDIAVMRALGARRDVLMLIILLESLLISLIGGGLGWVAGHAIGVLASPIVEYRTGIQLGFSVISHLARTGTDSGIGCTGNHLGAYSRFGCLPNRRIAQSFQLIERAVKPITQRKSSRTLCAAPLTLTLLCR